MRTQEMHRPSCTACSRAQQLHPRLQTCLAVTAWHPAQEPARSASVPLAKHAAAGTAARAGAGGHPAGALLLGEPHLRGPGRDEHRGGWEMGAGAARPLLGRLGVAHCPPRPSAPPCGSGIARPAVLPLWFGSPCCVGGARGPRRCTVRAGLRSFSPPSRPLAPALARPPSR